MKKIFALITLFVTLLSGNAIAQKARMGITAGATTGTYKVKAESVSVTSKGKLGFTIGVFSDIPLGHSTSFMPALNFVQKGGTLKQEGVKDRLTVNYLEVPLNFVYKGQLTNGKFFIGGGPSFSAGLSGKDKWDVEGSSGSDKVKFGKDEDFKRFEAGINAVTGYIGKSGMMISLNYNTSLSNAVDNEGGDGKFHYRYVGLRLGLML